MSLIIPKSRGSHKTCFQGTFVFVFFLVISWWREKSEGDWFRYIYEKPTKFKCNIVELNSHVLSWSKGFKPAVSPASIDLSYYRHIFRGVVLCKCEELHHFLNNLFTAESFFFFNTAFIQSNSEKANLREPAFIPLWRESSDFIFHFLSSAVWTHFLLNSWPDISIFLRIVDPHLTRSLKPPSHSHMIRQDLKIKLDPDSLVFSA